MNTFIIICIFLAFFNINGLNSASIPSGNIIKRSHKFRNFGYFDYDLPFFQEEVKKTIETNTKKCPVRDTLVCMIWDRANQKDRLEALAVLNNYRMTYDQ
jgi:hypothetical protein